VSSDNGFTTWRGNASGFTAMNGVLNAGGAHATSGPGQSAD